VGVEALRDDLDAAGIGEDRKELAPRTSPYHARRN
jgi:hypothetical protein